MATPKINRTIQSAKRYQEILAVLLRHGFQDFVTESGIDEWISTGKSMLGAPLPDVKVKKLSRAVRLRKVLEELGPTFIKLGQVLSTRPDLIPAEWAEEFAKLQDNCPRVEFSKIKAQLDNEFKGEVDNLFSAIDTDALAAGSLAQVHRAVLKNGTKVVIKVLRPDAREKIDADMEVLAGLANFVERHLEQQGYSPSGVVDELSRQLKKEVNLVQEGQATDRLREYFAEDERICFPKVHWDATTTRVLTMEEINGNALSRTAIDSLNHTEKDALVKTCCDAVFKQCLEFGYFHADPHPGNIFRLEGGKIAFIDCGMTGHIDRKTSNLLADIVSAAVSGDIDKVINAGIEMAHADPTIANDRLFRRDVSEFISRFEHSTLQTLDIGSLLEAFFELLRKYRIRCPSDIVFLVKAITTIEGVAEQISPSFDVVGYVRPYIINLVAQRYGLIALRDRMQKSMRNYIELVEQIPEGLQTLLQLIRGNRFSVKLEHRGLNQLTDTVDHASRNIAYALITAALLVGSSILVLATSVSPDGGSTILEIVGLVGLIAALFLTVLLILTNRMRRK